MNIFIEKIELSDYRSCKKTIFPVNEKLSALIGPNGSGKSNILNGILLLKKIAKITRNRREEEYPPSACKLKVWFNVDGHVVPYQAIVSYNTNDRNIDDVVGAEQKWNFEAFTGKKKWQTLPLSISYEIERFISDSDLSKFPSSQKMQILRSLGKLIDTNIPSNEKVFDVVNEIFRFVSGISYYSASQFTDPSKSPTSFEIENSKLSPRIPRSLNSEHFQFLYDVYSVYKNKSEEFDEFMSIVGRDGIGLVDNFEFNEVDVPSSFYQVFTGGRLLQKEIKKNLVIPNLTIKSVRLSPNQLSEGTFKTLGIIFYLITDKSSLLLIEEPEVCVHHGLLASIVELIKAFSQKKQIILSTHSDFVLDEIEPENVFVVRFENQKGTIVKNIVNSMSVRDLKALKNYLETSGNLGEYWKYGDLEKWH